MSAQFRFAAVLLGVSAISSAAYADSATLTVTSKAFENGGQIPRKFAYCAPDGGGKTKNSDNISPDISWSAGPAGTKSYAVIVTDPDVPADFSDANQDGKTISNNADRKDFYHWSLVNIPATVTSLPEGVGKGQINATTGKMDFIGWPGINDYASFMKDKPQSQFYGYDGPCPPWNDLRIHHYHFAVYALDTEKPMYLSTFTGKNAFDAVESHMLAKGEIVGTFSNHN